ncbi:MAG: hypothetical protein ACRC0V_03615 [Fusobacteriaceae bacterium]
MKAKLTKLQVFKNAEREFLNYQKNHENLLASHKKYRLEYGISEVEVNLKRKEELSKKRLENFKIKMKKAKLDME